MAERRRAGLVNQRTLGVEPEGSPGTARRPRTGPPSGFALDPSAAAPGSGLFQRRLVGASPPLA